MSIVHECAHEDCGVLTMGEFCVDHERAGQRLAAALLVRAVEEAEHEESAS